MYDMPYTHSDYEKVTSKSESTSDRVDQLNSYESDAFMYMTCLIHMCDIYTWRLQKSKVKKWIDEW